MWIRFFGVLVFLVGLCLGGYGLHQMLEQDRAVHFFKEVQARVLDTSIDVSRNRHGSTYTPKVQYQYTAQEHVVRGDRISVAGESFNSRSDAEELLDHYPVDALVPAYVDPDDYESSVLLRNYSVSPYWMGLFGLWGAWLGVMMVSGLTTTGPKGMRTVAMGEDWHLLLPRKNLKRRYRESIAWFIGTAAVMLLVGGHYLKAVHPFGIGGYFLLPVAAGWLLFQTVMTLRRRGVQSSVSDARLQVNPVPLRREAPVAVRVELDALKALRVESAKVKVVCTEHYQERRGNKTQTTTRVRGERSIDISGAKAVAAGEVLEGQGTVELDPSWPPTSSDQVHFPYFTWDVRVRVALAGAADYAEDFVVEVG